MGRILQTLTKQGFADNTIVVFSSDQGLAVGGRHGLMGKQNLYEHVKPPLIFAGPGISKGETQALVYLLDISPTVCDLIGAEVPAGLDGKSLAPIIDGKSSGVRGRLSEWAEGRHPAHAEQARTHALALFSAPNNKQTLSAFLDELTNDFRA